MDQSCNRLLQIDYDARCCLGEGDISTEDPLGLWGLNTLKQSPIILIFKNHQFCIWLKLQ